MEYSNTNDPWLNTGYDPYKGMTNQERVKAGCLSMIFMLGTALLVFGTIAMLCGCKSVEYIPVPEYHTDTLIKTKVQKDSVYLHDSISVKENGDTLLIERWHTKYVEKLAHDTTYIHKTDSVPYPYPVKEYIEKPLTATQKWLMGIGICTVLALVVFIAVKLKRFLP